MIQVIPISRNTTKENKFYKLKWEAQSDPTLHILQG